MRLPTHIIYIGLVFISFLLTACIKAVDEITLTGQRPLTINALITNDQGPFFVQITQSSNRLQDYTSNQNSGGRGIVKSSDGRLINEPIVDAIVTLTDDQGNAYQLQPWDQVFDNAAIANTWAELGVYTTSGSLKGVPGRTYTLNVKHEGQEYKATATIPPLPPSIDEVTFVEKILTKGQPEPYKIPTVSFTEPQDQENYYMFFYERFDEDGTGTSISQTNLWTMFFEDVIIFDDQFLKANVKQLSLDSGLETGQGLDPLFSGGSVRVEMHSLSKAAYEFYNALKAQIRNDGGAFSQAPASPPTNFSNGALGFFRASSVSTRTVPIPQ